VALDEGNREDEENHGKGPVEQKGQGIGSRECPGPKQLQGYQRLIAAGLISDEECQSEAARN
jgi:hypothetical protein